MWAKIPVYLGVAAVCGAGLLYIAGLLLPETRSLSKTIVFDAPIDIVYRTVTDNRHWHYRTSPDDLRIVSENAGREVWLETTGGITIRFETLDKHYPDHYAFKMEHRLFDGIWTAELEAVSANRTRFTATENIRYKNPFVRAVGHALMDLDKMMRTYQDELAGELARQTRISDGLDMTELLDLIRNESAGTVGETLDFWLYECSMDEAPSAAEVAQWRDILNARGGRFSRLAALCQTWLDEEQP